VSLLSKRTSKRVAKDRLKLVLIHDRANCSPELLEMIKTDIINVISKYMDIDEDGLDIKMGNTKSEISDGIVPALYANIPIKKMKKKA
jgi:cell division topological specificity factor